MRFYDLDECFKMYDYKFKELTQEDIEKIYKVNNTFLAHRDRLLSFLFQGAEKLNEHTFGNNLFRLCIKNDGCFEIGYWEYCIKPASGIFEGNYTAGSYIIGSDIISLVALFYDYTFIKAIDLIYGHIVSNETLYPHVLKGKGGYREELFPIVKKFDFVRNNNVFMQQLEQAGAVLYPYLINNLLVFLFKYYYKNKHNNYIEIFFGYFHRYNSPQLTFIAMDISKFNSLRFQKSDSLNHNYDLQSILNIFYDKFQKRINFLLLDLPNEFRENKLKQLPSNFPYGIMIKNINFLYQFDFSPLRDYIVFVEIDINYYKDKKILLSSLQKLKEIEKKYHIDFYFYCSQLSIYSNGSQELDEDFKNFVSFIYESFWGTYFSLTDFMTCTLYQELVIEDTKESPQETVQSKKILSSGFSLAKNGFANQDKKVECILSPIINSGQVVWLFAPEKLGKTFLAMSIAYVVSKGNSSVCGWEAKEPKKVFYIDGEMSGTGLNKIYSLVANGFSQENCNEVYFDSFLFAEDYEDYETILDSEWLEQYNNTLYQYDLIILDNYYSLNKNNKSLKEFFVFLRDLKKHNVAVLVVDHTNRSGELQGSIDKRRFADLGISLQYGASKDEIIVSYEFDRHGSTSRLPSKKYYKEFIDERFRFVEVIEAENIFVRTELTDEAKIWLLEYLLYEVYHFKQNEISGYHSDKNYHKRVNEHCKELKNLIETKNSKKFLDQVNLIVEQYNYYKNEENVSKNDCLTEYKELLKKNGQLKIQGVNEE